MIGLTGAAARSRILLDPLKRDTFAGSGLVIRDPILDTLRRERLVGVGLLLTALRVSGFRRLMSG